MACNIAGWDRLLRLLTGTLLTAWTVAGGPWWGYIGLYLIVTGAWRFCPVYAIFKISTFKAS